ncbi:BNR repeat-containing protein [Paraburkholderia sp. RAU2J]|uniref:BNR repeat-containing protein n=1 Tax=Paraburkholderia sp. RAU2J TaxID=1938810 RepID=UPI000EABEB98|nr:BNR repeat-containing protein [Paraburkholderia sp. RAU2J]
MPLRIDGVWAGTRVAFSAMQSGSKIYVGYYDVDRYLSVAQIDLTDGSIKKQRLNSRFAGWDAHNYISLAIDGNGLVHVSGNEHGTPLVYARTKTVGDVSTVALERTLTGSDESRVTYPAFLKTKDGKLYFVYREGASGNGNHVIDRFDGNQWRRLFNTPLFASGSGADSSSAYPTVFERDSKGVFHVAWVWRKTPDARTNFNVSYARSPDLVNWFNARGTRVKLPLTPSSETLVDRVPTQAGLFNNIKLGFGLRDEPIISYQKYDADGHSQIFHASLKGTHWHIGPVTHWSQRWEFAGTGSIDAKISFSGVSRTGHVLTETFYSLWDGTQTYAFDASGMNATQISAATPWKAAVPVPSFPAPFRFTRASVADNGGSPPSYSLVWGSLPPDNHDRPRECQAAGSSAGCRFVSGLYLVPNSDR